MIEMWRRWPLWTPTAALAGSMCTTLAGVYWGLGGALGTPLGNSVVGWILGGVGAVGVVAVASRTAWLCWLAAASLLASAFGLVMDLVMLLGVGHVDDSWGFAAKLTRVVTLILLAGAALSFRRAAKGVCRRCGFDHADRDPRALRFPEPSRAPAWVRWTAYAGAIAFLPYIGCKTAWALGMELGGWRGPELVAVGGFQGLLARVGLDLTAVLGALAVFLILALTRPWSQLWPRWTLVLAGRRVPRWLPLTPALLGASTLAPYGLIGTVALFTVPMDGAESPGWFAFVGMLAFGVPGIAMAVTGWSYLRRTRPRCAPTEAAAATIPVSSEPAPAPPDGPNS